MNLETLFHFCSEIVKILIEKYAAVGFIFFRNIYENHPIKININK